jgi:P-type Ca2+ transporter type 2C
MTARQLVTSTGVIRVSGEGYAPVGAFLADDGQCTPADDPLLYDLLRAAAACNDAELGEQHDRPTVVGDPTEGALLVVAAKGEITRQDIEAALPRLGTLPFDSERKRMTVIRQHQGQPWAFVKGAPEVILARCSRLRTNTGVETLTDSTQVHMLEASALMANEALRMLALAERPLGPVPGVAHEPLHADDLERDLILLGLVGLQDPPPA